MYPPLEYSPSSTKEDWIFKEDNRDVLNKLIETYKKQEVSMKETADKMAAKGRAAIT